MPTTDKKATLITTDQASTFISGDAIIWGKRRKMVQIDGEWRVHKMLDQWIARFLLNENGSEHLHWYCTSEKIARRLYLEAILWNGQPRRGRKDIAQRIRKCTTWSYGLQEDWMKDPVIELHPPSKPFPFIRGYDYEDKNGEPSAFRGPYGLDVDPLKNEDDDEPHIWVQGRLVKVGEVSDILVDSTITERDLEAIEKQLGWLEREEQINFEGLCYG